MDFCGVSHPGDLAAFCVVQDVVLSSFLDESPAQCRAGRSGNIKSRRVSKNAPRQ